ncbi:hypothetical protein KAR91_12695 [Candidatus Pacearchaeota archaeon]|nr:hypothetical protein [Candidatus Pacearchaeota archaeon]
MTNIASRFKDALWSIRRAFGMEPDLDRIINFVAFDRDLDETKVFITYPRRIPEDFRSALLARIREIVRQYDRYRCSKKGYHRVVKGIMFLENVARVGADGCCLSEDKNDGFRLELK